MSNRSFSRSTTIALAAAAASALALSSEVRAAVPVIDGTLDAGVYTRFATQTVNSGFNDPGLHQSELDAGYYHIESGKLYIFLAGNIESNFNHPMVFFDTRAGGQNPVLNNNPDADFNALNTHYAGMKFDTAFTPDYAFWTGRDTGTMYANFSEMNTTGGGLGGYLGSITTPNANQQGSGTVGGSSGLPTMQIGYSDANTGGVGNGSAALDPAGIAAAQAVSTGEEFSIDLTALGITGDFKMMVGINSASHDFWSNQFLAGLTGPQGNLGGDGTGGVTTTDFSALTGDQFSTISYHAPVGGWKTVGNSNWNNVNNWNGDGIPNAADASAVLGTDGGAGAHTITLDTNVSLQKITFDSPGSYTIAQGGAFGITIAGNPASPAVLVNQGSHTIGVPLTLGATTNFTVAAGASLDVTGDLIPSTFTVVKEGAGSLQFKQLNVADIFIDVGTVSVATNGTAANVSKITSLRISGTVPAPTATLDLKDNDMVVSNLNYADTTTLIANARHAGAWDQTGITSSAAKNQAQHITGLGAISGAEFHGIAGANATFDGLTVADTDTLVKYTYNGDTDLNGSINGADYARIDQNFNNQVSQGNIAGWVNGDFDYNGKIDGADYALIDAAFNGQGGTVLRLLSFMDGSDRNRSTMTGSALGEALRHFDEFGETYAASVLTSVPEPATLSLAALAGGALIARRRRRD